MDDKLSDDILKNISLYGVADDEKKSIEHIIAGRDNLSVISTLAFGRLTFRARWMSRFRLIASKPVAISALSSLSYRCCLCGEVIGFPVWYMRVEYSVNRIHYFVCYKFGDSEVGTKCYRR